MPDRAVPPGHDGASHNGQWDMSLLRLVPGLRMAAPRDEDSLRAALQAAVEVDDAPTVVRYPKGPLPPALPALDSTDGVDVLGRHDGPGRSVLVVGVGPMAHTAVHVADLLAAEGLGVTAVDPGWVLPVPEALVKAVGEHSAAVVLEDGVVDGGVGAMLAQQCVRAGVPTPVLPFGVPAQFLPHATRAQLVEALRLRAEDVAHDVLGRLATPAVDDPSI